LHWSAVLLDGGKEGRENADINKRQEGRKGREEERRNINVRRRQQESKTALVLP
jgi:hypothetical protein